MSRPPEPSGASERANSPARWSGGAVAVVAIDVVVVVVAVVGDVVAIAVDVVVGVVIVGVVVIVGAVGVAVVLVGNKWHALVCRGRLLASQKQTGAAATIAQ